MDGNARKFNQIKHLEAAGNFVDMSSRMPSKRIPYVRVWYYIQFKAEIHLKYTHKQFMAVFLPSVLQFIVINEATHVLSKNKKPV